MAASSWRWFVMTSVGVAALAIGATAWGAPSCVSGPQEAETGLPTGLIAGTDGAASGGAYIHRPDGVGSSWSPNTAFQVSYCFTVAQSGTYRIKARVWADSGVNDSFWVKVDGALTGSGHWDVAHVAYGDDYVNSYGVTDPVEISLTAGDHLVEVLLREDGTRLDRIELEPVTIAGLKCGPPLQEAETGSITGFATGSDNKASNKKFIHRPEGAGSAWSAKPDFVATYCFKLESDATYRLNAGAQGPSSTSDSFFVRLDSGAAFRWDVAQGTSFVEDYANSYLVADPIEWNLTAGPHRVDIYLREDGTKLDWVELEKRTEALGQCGGLAHEAEAGALTGMVVGGHPKASGGSFIHQPDGAGSNWTPKDSNRATYCFRVQQAGTYRIAANVHAASGTSDSFWVAVDGVQYGRWDTLLNTEFLPDYIGIRGGEDPLVVTLSAGRHLVDVYLREDGTCLDKISLESVP